ncbi:alpha/beta fold hydrolase [Deinococcus yavapaiensis]|uniref:Pimeloyl-ACP methyl ester carboxylesterase n=1 Tax=Deinococcus yavapaiensis KR-236 TaxID=694435 RepID=A0A318S223_9DEIO|nr:alpha/beta hydrolase [Deinococcus yavapaiensis]PYE48987.1 pimeloyl-ACP methyl ester carboxylesterase [Deinococcus yavapaiensis KR-236]
MENLGIKQEGREHREVSRRGTRSAAGSRARLLAASLTALIGTGAAQGLNGATSIDVGGYKLYVECDGTSKKPTLLFLSGTAPMMGAWLASPAASRTDARTCWSTTAGVLPSEAPPRVTDGLTRAEDLARALERAGERGPFVLVTYGFGSQIARLFADRHANQVAGMVLVNPWQEDTAQAIARFFSQHPWKANGTLAPALQDVAFLQSFSRSYASPNGGILTDARWNLRAGDEQTRRAKSLGSLPLVVVTPMLDAFTIAQDTANVAAGQQLWKVLAAQQTKLVKLSTRGTQLFSDRSWDMVQNEDPDLVTRAIDRVLSQVTTTSTSR